MAKTKNTDKNLKNGKNVESLEPLPMAGGSVNWDSQEDLLTLTMHVPMTQKVHSSRTPN